MIRLCRRLCALFAVLAIAANLTAGSNASAISGDMDSPAGMADVSSPTSCYEADCPDHEMTGAACQAACSGTLAVLSTGTAIDLRSDLDLHALAMPGRIGQTSPPDHSPPRLSVLS